MKTTVAVGYDQTPSSEIALAEAARAAALRGASLTVLTVYNWPTLSEPSTLNPADELRGAGKRAEEIALHGAGRARALYPQIAVEARPVQGYAGKVLAEATHTAALLIVGHRGGGGFSGMSLGSTAMRALAEACCPVIVVRGAPASAHDRIVAAVDIDEPCESVLDFAFTEASLRNAGLTVVHVWDEPWILDYGREDPGATEDIAQIEQERGDRLEALVRDARRRHPEVHPFRQVATGSAGSILVEASRRADLLVSGARRHGEGRHGLLIGPVTQTLLHHAECAVAVVPVD